MADHEEISVDDADDGKLLEAPTRSAAQVAKEERIKRLQDLKLRKNEATNLNRKEVVEEDKRNKLPANWEAKKRRVEWELADEQARKEAEERGEDYERLQHMKLSATDAEKLLEKQRKKEKQADPGFADYRQSAARSYKKLSSQIKPDMNAYAREMIIKGDDVFYDPAKTLTYGDKERTQGDNIDRLVADLKRQDERRLKYKRHRAVHDDADIDYINEANRKFNMKIERFYGESTAEIKQSLERGTAL